MAFVNPDAKHFIPRHPSALLSRMIDEIPNDSGFDGLIVALDSLAHKASGLMAADCGPIWTEGANILAKYFLVAFPSVPWQQRLVDMWMDRTEIN